VNLASNLRAGQCRLKRWITGILLLLVLATAWAAPGAESTAPGRSPSEADKKLLHALEQGKLPLLRAAIAEGADVNRRGTNSLPPLLALLRAATAPLDTERRQCVACLLEHGAAVDPTDSDRRTPLIHAARLGDLETVRLLVEAEAYIMARDRFHKSALFYAVEARRRDIVLYLAANGDLVSLTVKERKASR
jgi:ankyrin repeat protein